ncbi:MAG: signal transduction histidine kinase/ActR/RegA family two-component response regulator [Desulforhopalus sp.]
MAPVSDSMWNFDESNVRLQLEGILKIPGIEYCFIRDVQDTSNEMIEVGDASIRRDITESYELVYRGHLLGTLNVTVNFDYIYNDLQKVSVFDIISRGVEVFIIAIIVLLIINQVLLRHFTTISSYARNLDIDHLDRPLVLKRLTKDDELQLVVTAINDMRLKIQKDIKHSRVVQRELEFNHNLLVAQQETSWEGILVIDGNDKILSYNQRFIEMWGIPDDVIASGVDDELVKHVLDKVVDPDGFRARIEYLYSNQNESSKDTIVFLDGRVIERNSGPIYGKDNICFGRVWYFRDITHEVLAEQTLQNSHERFLTVLNSIDATIYVADMETSEIIFMNKHIIESFGRDMTGENCWRSFRNENGPCDVCTNEKLIDENGIPTGVHVWKDVNPITGRAYVNHDRAIEWTDGRLVRLQIATDISDLHQMEEQLRQVQKMESLGRLAGGVAHDFNNMLSIILGNVEMILIDMDPANPLGKSLLQIQKAAQRSSDFTKQLLAFARKQTIAPKVINLNETLEGMLTMLRRLIGEDIELIWRLQTDLWAVKMDPSQVDQILANLCLNARDAIIEGGQINIETENIVCDTDYCIDHEDFVPGNYVVTSVSDNGRGIGKENIDKLFEPFFTTKEVGKGTGLGLATVYGIVKQNNGFINAYSEAGPGATFKIYLPQHSDAGVSHTENTTLEIEHTGWETILLVEDEKALLDMTQKMLERLGYTVMAANSPEDAVSISKEIDSGKIHLLLSDVVMPGMNGQKLSEELLLSHTEMKCIFVSGYTADVIAHHGVLKEGVDFINKPFSIQDLAVKVRSVLDVAV